MESTASYWKPLVNIFEITNLDYTIINARDYKNLPEKKTDGVSGVRNRRTSNE